MTVSGTMGYRNAVLPLLCLALAVAALTFTAGCNSVAERAPTGGLGAPPLYHGPATLEETIARSDVIVRARLLSVTAVAERNHGDIIAALDHRFQVLEYLRGSGGNELVAVAEDTGETFSSAGDAVERANALKDRRDTRWDNLQAVIFLEDAVPGLPSTSRADRYRLGAVSFHRPYEDYYTVSSRWGKNWLPAAQESGSGAGASSSDQGQAGEGAVAVARPGSDGQLFLLDAPMPPSSDDEGDPSAASFRLSPTAPEINLGSLKGKIDANNRAIAAGGGSEAYKDCLYLKLKWEREVRYTKNELGGSYYYKHYDEAIGSGLPSGTRAYTDPHGGSGETAPSDAGDFPIIGRDAALFTTKWPGVADTVRPLPAGQYKFYYDYRPKEYIICDGVPDEEKKRREVFVTVTAPARTVHEALFDPVAIGSAVGADASNGALKPTSFSVNGTRTALQSLKWQGGTVTLELSVAVSLSGHALDFIAPDGTVALSLDGGVATASGNTLAWTVASQPWQAGDMLMLRIREASANPAATGEPAKALGN